MASKTDLFAYEEWLLIICFWLYFMASALGTFENSHVNADLLNYLTDNKRWIWLRSVVVCAIELVVSATVIYWSILMLQDELASYPNWQATIALKIPFIVPRIAVLAGFTLMTFYSGLRLYVLLKLRPGSQAWQASGDGDEAASGRGS